MSKKPMVGALMLGEFSMDPRDPEVVLALHNSLRELADKLTAKYFRLAGVVDSQDRLWSLEPLIDSAPSAAKEAEISNAIRAVARAFEAEIVYGACVAGMDGVLHAQVNVQSRRFSPAWSWRDPSGRWHREQARGQLEDPFMPLKGRWQWLEEEMRKGWACLDERDPLDVAGAQESEAAVRILREGGLIR